MNSSNPKVGATAALIALASLTACGGSGSGDANAAETPAGASETSATMTPSRPAVPQGATMTFVVDEEVSTDNTKKGDHFMSTLVSDAQGTDGRPLVRAGSKGQWVVLESTRDNGDGQAVLAAALTSVQVNGRWVPVEATVTSADLDKDAKDTDTQTAAKIAIGTAAGAVLGKVIGKSNKAAIEGAGVGAVVGTAVALTTRGASATLHRGSRLTVRLDEKLVPGER